MNRLLKFFGYLLGFVLGFCGASVVIDKIEEKKNKTYFTV